MGKGWLVILPQALFSPTERAFPPDAAWTAKQRVRQLTPAERDGFWDLCPDFVIELRSPSDRLRAVRDKMREWIANGASLAWLIDPADRSATIYRPVGAPETLAAAETVTGEAPVEGFVLILERVWDPLR